MSDLLKVFIKTLVERQVREADITGDKRVAWGSDEHVDDLERRIVQLQSWQKKQPRGSAKRSDYTRLIQQLKSELASARRAAEKRGCA